MIKDMKKGSLFLNTVNMVKSDIIRFLKAGKCAMIARQAKDMITFNPVNYLGLIILIAVITNIMLSLLLAKASSSISWFMRVNFLLIGTLWASCKIELNDIKKTSLCYKLIRKRSK